MLLKIVQLSDLHLGEENELTFGANSRSNFEAVLACISGYDPDMIWVSGDLCLDEPVATIYPWVKQKLDNLSIPYHVIPGNHDDSVMLANVFHKDQLKNRELYYSKRINGHFIVFLDSARGRFTDVQWDWFQTQLEPRDEMIHIVMHHPPIFAGVPFLDNNHAFIEQERFIDIMDPIKHNVHVYCGHYHTSRYVQHEHIHMHLCPSTLFQMDSLSSDFKLDSTTPGFQLITLSTNRVETKTIWCTESITEESQG